MKLGVVQGRLSEPVYGHIQQFPLNWEREFELIDDIGLNHIEWLVTAISFSEKKHDVDASKYSEKISSIGCDNLTNKNIKHKSFLDEQLDPICKFATLNNIKSITIPLLEDSKVDDFVDTFIKNINDYSTKYPNLKFNFELESDYEIALRICKSNKKFFITYDTGNITACKFNHYEYIKNCFEYIDTVHLKDKTLTPVKNVEPMTGDANFTVIFKTLRELNYNGLFTLQTNRGITGEEIETIKRHKKLFEEMYARFI